MKRLVVLFVVLSAGFMLTGCVGHSRAALGTEPASDQIDRIRDELPASYTIEERLAWLDQNLDRWGRTSLVRWHDAPLMIVDRERDEIRIQYHRGRTKVGGPWIYMAPKLDWGPQPMGELIVGTDSRGRVSTRKERIEPETPAASSQVFFDSGLLKLSEWNSRYRARKTIRLHDGKAQYEVPDHLDLVLLTIVDPDTDEQCELQLNQVGFEQPVDFRWLPEGVSSHPNAGDYAGADLGFVPEKEFVYRACVFLPRVPNRVLEFEVTDCTP